MSVNPYESPKAVEEESVAASLATPEEDLATWRIRFAVLLMAGCAVANLACITAADFLNGPWIFFYIAMAWNLLCMGLIIWALWRFTPEAVDCLARQLHRLFGGTTALDAWITTYRHALWTMPPAATVGVPLWLFWLVCHFGFGMPIGGPLNTLFLIAGNAIGAWVYVSIIAGWVRLRMAESAPIPS